MGCDFDTLSQDPVEVKKMSAVMADGSGVNQQKGRKGQLRVAIGIAPAGAVQPLGGFTNTDWSEIEQIIKEPIKQPRL